MIKSPSRQENGPQNELINFKSLNLEFSLWPPSVNQITAVVHGRKIKSRQGRAFHEAVCAQIDELRSRIPVAHFSSPVRALVVLFPPTRSRRDIDNYSKAILDGMTQAGVWDDDSLIDELTIRRGEVRKGGWFRIEIEELPPCR